MLKDVELNLDQLKIQKAKLALDKSKEINDNLIFEVKRKDAYIIEKIETIKRKIEKVQYQNSDVIARSNQLNFIFNSYKDAAINANRSCHEIRNEITNIVKVLTENRLIKYKMDASGIDQSLFDRELYIAEEINKFGFTLQQTIKDLERLKI